MDNQEKELSLEETFELLEEKLDKIGAGDLNWTETISNFYGDFDKLYVIYGMDELDKYELSKVKDSYGFESIKHTYLVNFDKAEVDLLKSIIIADKEVRTFEQVRALVDNGEI